MSEKVTNFMWTTIEGAFAFSEKNSAKIPANKSLYDYFKDKLAETDFTQPEKEAALELSKLWGSYIGSPIDRQSLKFFFLEECLEGGKSYLILSRFLYPHNVLIQRASTCRTNHSF